MKRKSFRTPIIIAVILLIAGLGCSVGALVVQAPQPTPTPTKTPRPIFTPTLIPTETPTPTNTPTLTPVPTDTPTLVPTETVVPTDAPTNTPVPQATNTPAPPPPPTNTPAPTNTPEPTFPFPAQLTTHPTGGAVEFRITGFVWEGTFSTGIGEALTGYQMKVITPNGEEEYSEVSVGPQAGSSTFPGAGDNHSMNFQYKHAPYQPGVYKVTLVKDGQPMSPTIEVVAQASPFTYAHIDFIRQK